MKTRSLTKLRRSLSEIFEDLTNDHEPMLITRGGKPSAVLVSLEDFASCEVTGHLLRSPVNAARLRAAVNLTQARARNADSPSENRHFS